LKSRLFALSLAGGIAGVAGALYMASTPSGAPPNAFDPLRSLDVMSMAVVGGLGSPFGALLGAALLQAGRIALPGPWAALASGGGVLIVVILRPAGLSGIFTWLRDLGVRVIAGRPAREEPSAPVEEAA
jgi:branched-chain amino acid transport system permease protein